MPGSAILATGWEGVPRRTDEALGSYQTLDIKVRRYSEQSCIRTRENICLLEVEGPKYKYIGNISSTSLGFHPPKWETRA